MIGPAAREGGGGGRSGAIGPPACHSAAEARLIGSLPSPPSSLPSVSPCRLEAGRARLTDRSHSQRKEEAAPPFRTLHSDWLYHPSIAQRAASRLAEKSGGGGASQQRQRQPALWGKRRCHIRRARPRGCLRGAGPRGGQCSAPPRGTRPQPAVRCRARPRIALRPARAPPSLLWWKK